ncbi:AIPR family protein [Hymenobacter glacieicola]|uniref:Abortive phage infection protein C-terminal domain-containing protein n=1 Tax=Hymenobacter glacieicola TaxID=1562124 RepID=A0ABQ1WLJ1_9BACT|nr:AIPR family protein [Hymenobacter glacieicola]GGG35551.1 hypothetical protein GCM10011378_09760 [Hymenobacter glacieicola]
MSPAGTIGIPNELGHVQRRLRTDFTGLLPEATIGTEAEREANFLSRALAAFTIHRLSGCTLVEAAAAVVDGYADGGIDAIHYTPTSHEIWIVQSKYHQNGRGEPALGDVTKFRAGIDDLLHGRFEAFDGNASWRAKLPQLRNLLGFDRPRVRAVLAYSGIHTLSDDRHRLLDAMCQAYLPDDDFLQWKSCNLTTLYDWITGAEEAPGVPEVQLTLLYPGWVRTPYETIYGLLPLSELAALAQQHGTRLIAANLRGYQGDTVVNQQITATVTQEPENFFYFNNGLTAYCERLNVHAQDSANTERKRVRAVGFSVVNGAQTLGAVAAALAGGAAAEGHVFLKIMSLERVTDDIDFAERITRNTNLQNQVTLRDFAALDEQQARLARQLMLDGITYHYKESHDTPASDGANFTLREATAVCAILFDGEDCEFCARLTADPESLWSKDTVYPDDALYPSRYARIFRAELTGRELWRAVQVQQVVWATLPTEEASMVRQEYFTYGRWLILLLVFLRLHPERGDTLTLTETDQRDIAAMAERCSEVLWQACLSQGIVGEEANGSFSAPTALLEVFGRADDCSRLRKASLRQLYTS